MQSLALFIVLLTLALPGRAQPEPGSPAPASSAVPISPLPLGAAEAQIYAGRIRRAIQLNILVPEPIAGNPSAEVEVRTATDGTIVSVKLLQSSGSETWDKAVQLALARTERLPVASNGFVPPVLVITFRPKQ
jgi:TonB family protein